MLRDSVVVVVRTRPRAIPLAIIITMRKSTHGFPFVSHIWVAYGAPLGGPSGRRSSAIRGSTNSRNHHFLPECFAPFYQNASHHEQHEVWHRCGGVLFLRGLRLRQVSGYGLLWFTCKAMWARSCLTFTTLDVVVNAEFESLEIWTINCDVLI